MTDEPDLVKTDGKRIVTVQHGKLYVVDPATRRLTGELELAPGADQFGGAEDGLLLHGDRALVLRRDGWAGMATTAVPEGGGRVADAPMPDGIVGPRLIMVDLSGEPKIIGDATADDWLPRYEVTSGGRTSAGRVGCERVSRPAAYSGTSLVTVLSFDLGVVTLGAGAPVNVIADGDTAAS